MLPPGLCTLSGVVCGLVLFTTSSHSHKIDSRFADISGPIYESFHDSVYARDTEQNDTFQDALFSRTQTELKKRGLYNFATNGPGDTTILQQGFLDMVDVVTHNANNPNAGVLARYFRPGDQGQVTQVFQTVLQMAQAGGFPNPPPFPGGRISPTDLSEINVVHSTEVQLRTLAESFDVQPVGAANPLIKVYNFGWNGLWQRLRQSLQCGRDITGKTNYKMHFLGTLLLHETLHFNSVSFLAGLPAGQYLDDQPGAFPCTGLAYGPWEATQLLARDGAKALLNIENYVWYALENYWGNECGHTFTAAQSNDIPATHAKFINMETALNIAYRAFNHGRTPTQSRQHKKELMYADERVRAVEQRPASLPASRSSLSQTTLALHPQASCLLFAILPPEIREKIFSYVLGGRIIHLTHISKRIACQRLEITNDQMYDDNPPTGDIPLQMPPNIQWENERDRIPKPGQFSSISLSLLQTCHAIYAEVTPILYNSNTFSMSSPLVLLYLKDHVLLPQRFADIRHLQLVPWVFFDNPELHLKKIYEPYDKQTWPRFWELVSRMNLTSLGLWLELWGKDEDCSLSAEWVQPMLKVKGIKNVGIHLQLRAGAWETTRLKSLEMNIEKTWTSRS
ncbi:hypothetical protein ACLMJK_004207 [Lecanora helva]